MAALRLPAAVKVAAALSNSGAQADGVSHLTTARAGPVCRISVVCLKKTRKVGSGAGLSGGWAKVPLSTRKQGLFPAGAAGGNARASAAFGDEEKKTVAPLTPVSATGQFLATLLENHPHLLPSAVESQLERLAEEREAAASTDASTSGTELVLYKRIAEMRAEERKRAVEETMYALIVQKFVTVGAPLVAKLPSTAGKESAVVNIGPAMVKELEAVHSDEALEMVREHLTMVLGGKGNPDWVDQHIVAQISKLRVGQVYAASIMFGYFLRRVDQRFQLEKTMKALSQGAVDQGSGTEQSADIKPSPEGDKLAAEAAAAVASMAAGNPSFNASNILQVTGKPCKLRSYVMSFDAATLQRSASMRTRESLTLIERHAEALFGKPDITIGPDGTMVLSKDDSVRINFSGLRRLVLEAVAFGSLLWDVESYVDAKYPLVAHQG